MRESKKYKQSEWLVEGPEEMAKLKADQAREVEDLKRRHEGEVEALKMKHERENDRQSKKDEAEAEREAQSESLEEGKLVADDLMIIKSIASNIAKEMENRVKKNRESGVNFINQLIRAAGMKKTVSAKGQRGGHLFLRQGDNISEDYGRGDQKGVANIRGTSYFDSAVGYGWESALKDMLRGHITQREFERAFPALTKKDFEPLLKSKEVKVRTQRYGVNDRDYKKKISQLMKGLKEKLDKNSDAGDYVKDFRKSDAPQFKGKSDKKIRQMAIAAYLDSKKG